MIKLKNIKKSKNSIECNIFPEDSRQSGHLCVDLILEEPRKYKLPAGYEWCRNHIAHATRELITLSKLEEIPDEKIIMWY